MILPERGDCMKDFPMFTTEYGVASLVLRELPYRGEAYITIQDSLEPEKLLEECISFCRICGAEAVYAKGHEILESRPFHTAMLEMRCTRERIPDTDAALWPVQKQTMETWRELYNKKARAVPNGAWMTEADSKEMLAKGDGYFIHRGEMLLGIGRASGEMIDWVASLVPGGGRDGVCALAHAVTADTAVLTVASANEKAMKLYGDIGFIKVKELGRWYRVL